jgi:hypothetical protein
VTGHGPDGASAAGLADQAAELVRGLNHATLPGVGGLSYPGDVYSVLIGLSVLAGRLPQALAQAETFLVAQLTAGRIVIVDGTHTGHPDAAVAEAEEYLRTARAAAHRLHVDLDRAAAALVWAAAVDP